MSKNSQFEVFSTVSLDINGLLAGISDFGEDIVLEAGSDISNFFTLQLKRVVAILYSRDSDCKASNYHKVAGDNF